MEDYGNLIEQCLLNVRIFILKAEYYKNHRAEWEDDRSDDCIVMAEENLAQAESLIRYL